ncbi:MAG: leucine-rich repeat domain-containing protein [Bacteroidota bacterium]
MIVISKHFMQAHSLEEALENPQQVTSLVLSRQELTRVPAKVWKKLPQLESLDLSHNKIKKLPKGLENLTQLRRLQLSFNSITRIEENLLGLLPQLKHLDLRKNKLRQLSLASTSLETLDLSENRLAGVAPVQLFCPELLHLNLSYNKLSMLSFEEADFPSLQYLNLSRNKLSELPIVPAQLYALVINHNRLKKLNIRGRILPNLQRLEVAHNPLELEVQSLSSFPHLSYLDVRYTPTTWPGLSALLHRLPKLRHLYGGLSRKLQDQVAGFLAEIPTSVSIPQKEVFFKLWQGFAAGPVQPEILWSGLNERWHPTIQIGAYYELLRKYPARPGQLRSRVWYIYGKPASPQLVERLQNVGVQLTQEVEEATGILLGSAFNGDISTPKAAPLVMEERMLTHWLDRQQSRFLTHSRELPQIANMHRLLTANDEASFQLGVQMLRAQGTPDDLIEELLKKWLQQDTTKCAEWEEVLLPYLPGDLQLALRDRQRIRIFPARRGKAGGWWKILQKA